MPSKYNILFDNNDDNAFPDEKSFIDWLFSNKKALEDSEFLIDSNIDNIDVKRIYDVLDFLKFYTITKKKCNLKMTNYNDNLLSLKLSEDVKKAVSEFVRLNDNGKFLRGCLIALGYYSSGKHDDNYLDLSIAFEIFQTSILIHDDIIDNAVMRRGMDTIPTSYKKHFVGKKVEDFLDKKNKVADSLGICIGDFGFYYAEELIVNGYIDNPYLPQILSYYHQIAIKTCYGEIIDVILPFKEQFYESDVNLEDKIMEIYRLKTAWYSVIGPYCLGLILGGVSSKNVSKMESVLLNVGVAFQIKDDLLGIYGDENIIGKSTNSDIEEYKQTILYSYVMKTEFKDELLKYYGKSDLSKKDIDRVKAIFEKSGAKKYAEEKVNKIFNQSLKDIDSMDFIDKDSKKILKGFIVYLENRSK